MSISNKFIDLEKKKINKEKTEDKFSTNVIIEDVPANSIEKKNAELKNNIIKIFKEKQTNQSSEKKIPAESFSKTKIIKKIPAESFSKTKTIEQNQAESIQAESLKQEDNNKLLKPIKLADVGKEFEEDSEKMIKAENYEENQIEILETENSSDEITASEDLLNEESDIESEVSLPDFKPSVINFIEMDKAMFNVSDEEHSEILKMFNSNEFKDILKEGKINKTIDEESEKIYFEEIKKIHLPFFDAIEDLFDNLQPKDYLKVEFINKKFLKENNINKDSTFKYFFEAIIDKNKLKNYDIICELFGNTDFVFAFLLAAKPFMEGDNINNFIIQKGGSNSADEDCGYNSDDDLFDLYKPTKYRGYNDEFKTFTKFFGSMLTYQNIKLMFSILFIYYALVLGWKPFEFFSSATEFLENLLNGIFLPIIFNLLDRFLDENAEIKNKITDFIKYLKNYAEELINWGEEWVKNINLPYFTTADAKDMAKTASEFVPVLLGVDNNKYDEIIQICKDNYYSPNLNPFGEGNHMTQFFTSIKEICSDSTDKALIEELRNYIIKNQNYLKKDGYLYGRRWTWGTYNNSASDTYKEGFNKIINGLSATGQNYLSKGFSILLAKKEENHDRHFWTMDKKMYNILLSDNYGNVDNALKEKLEEYQKSIVFSSGKILTGNLIVTWIIDYAENNKNNKLDREIMNSLKVNKKKQNNEENNEENKDQDKGNLKTQQEFFNRCTQFFKAQGDLGIKVVTMMTWTFKNGHQWFGPLVFLYRFFFFGKGTADIDVTLTRIITLVGEITNKVIKSTLDSTSYQTNKEKKNNVISSGPIYITTMPYKDYLENFKTVLNHNSRLGEFFKEYQRKPGSKIELKKEYNPENSEKKVTYKKEVMPEPIFKEIYYINTCINSIYDTTIRNAIKTFFYYVLLEDLEFTYQLDYFANLKRKLKNKNNELIFDNLELEIKKKSQPTYEIFDQIESYSFSDTNQIFKEIQNELYPDPDNYGGGSDDSKKKRKKLKYILSKYNEELSSKIDVETANSIKKQNEDLKKTFEENKKNIQKKFKIRSDDEDFNKYWNTMVTLKIPLFMFIENIKKLDAISQENITIHDFFAGKIGKKFINNNLADDEDIVYNDNALLSIFDILDINPKRFDNILEQHYKKKIDKEDTETDIIQILYTFKDQKCSKKYNPLPNREKEYYEPKKFNEKINIFKKSNYLYRTLKNTQGDYRKDTGADDNSSQHLFKSLETFLYRTQQRDFQYDWSSDRDNFFVSLETHFTIDSTFNNHRRNLFYNLQNLLKELENLNNNGINILGYNGMSNFDTEKLHAEQGLNTFEDDNIVYRRFTSLILDKISRKGQFEKLDDFNFKNSNRFLHILNFIARYSRRLLINSIKSNRRNIFNSVITIHSVMGDLRDLETLIDSTYGLWKKKEKRRNEYYINKLIKKQNIIESNRKWRNNAFKKVIKVGRGAITMAGGYLASYAGAPNVGFTMMLEGASDTIGTLCGAFLPDDVKENVDEVLDGVHKIGRYYGQFKNEQSENNLRIFALKQQMTNGEWDSILGNGKEQIDEILNSDLSEEEKDKLLNSVLNSETDDIKRKGIVEYIKKNYKNFEEPDNNFKNLITSGFKINFQEYKNTETDIITNAKEISQSRRNTTPKNRSLRNNNVNRDNLLQFRNNDNLSVSSEITLNESEISEPTSSNESYSEATFSDETVEYGGVPFNLPLNTFAHSNDKKISTDEDLP